MLLAAHELACTRGERHLFDSLHFALGEGEALHIAGLNGSGKTSLLRILAGLAHPAAGEVHWCGKNIHAAREEYCRDLIYSGHMPGVKDDLLAWENVVASVALSGSMVDADAARGALGSLGLGEAAELPTRALSQGQRKRVALARLQLISNTRVWILDEPFTALDHEAVAALCGTVDAHLERGGCVVYTTHQDIPLAARHARRVELGGAC